MSTTQADTHRETDTHTLQQVSEHVFKSFPIVLVLSGGRELKSLGVTFGLRRGSKGSVEECSTLSLDVVFNHGVSIGVT